MSKKVIDTEEQQPVQKYNFSQLNSHQCNQDKQETQEVKHNQKNIIQNYGQNICKQHSQSRFQEYQKSDQQQQIRYHEDIQFQEQKADQNGQLNKKQTGENINKQQFEQGQYEQNNNRQIQVSPLNSQQQQVFNSIDYQQQSKQQILQTKYPKVNISRLGNFAQQVKQVNNNQQKNRDFKKLQLNIQNQDQSNPNKPKQFKNIKYTFKQIQNTEQQIQMNFNDEQLTPKLQKSQQTNKNISQMIKNEPIKQQTSNELHMKHIQHSQDENQQKKQDNQQQNLQKSQPQQSQYEMSTSLNKNSKDINELYKKQQIVLQKHFRRQNKFVKQQRKNQQNIQGMQQSKIKQLKEHQIGSNLTESQHNQINFNQQQNNLNNQLSSQNQTPIQNRQTSNNHPVVYDHTHQQQQQLSSYSQSQQQQQIFNLQKYKGVQNILNSLLIELKSVLKYVKNDRMTNHFSVQNRNNGGSKFFSRASRNQSKSHNNRNNKSLMDIIQRRKIGSNHQTNFPVNSSNGNSTAYNERNYVSSAGMNNTFKAGKKMVPLGLGQLGNSTSYDLVGGRLKAASVKQQQDYNPNSYNRMNVGNEDEIQRQKLIINRNKINQILAASSSHKIKQQSDHQNQRHQKSNSFFIRQSNKKSQKLNGNNQSNQISSFAVNQNNNNNGSNSSKDISMMADKRKIIKSTNFSKINKGPIQRISEMMSGMSTIQRQTYKAKFFVNDTNNLQFSSFYNMTSVLKHVKKYLQQLAQGNIDNIQLILKHPNQSLLSHNNLNELINRRKLFKTALYLQRASIVAGICYGYIMITDQKGCLSYQTIMEQQLSSKNPNQAGSSANKQNTQNMKQQTKQILKYMINLASFSLNNCKLMAKTIEDFLLKQRTHFNDIFIQHSYLQAQNKQISQAARLKLRQQQNVQKQILKRNFQTIKLNIQYTQQTFLKLFSGCYPSINKEKQVTSKIDQDFGQSFKNISKLIHKNTIQQTFYTLLEYFSFYLAVIKRQLSIPFLSVAPNPYLDYSERYTLVIDFVQVFCHGTKKSKNFIFRPYSQHFLSQMSQYYDIVFICDTLPQQIDKIIDILDNKNVVKHRLYKYHLVYQKNSGRYIKSLQRIGRGRQKILLLDTQNNRIVEDSKNTIYINQWKGSKNDSSLAQLCSILISITVDELDCTKAAQKIDNQMKINYQNGIKFINFGLNLKEEPKEKVLQTEQNAAQQRQSNEFKLMKSNELPQV